MIDEIREMYREGFQMEIIARILNIPFRIVLEAIYGGEE